MSGRALLCDYGGVMTSPITASFTAFCATEGIEAEAFKNVMSGAARVAGSPFALVETGAITEEQFDERVATLLSDACGKDVAPTGLKRRMFAEVKPDEAMWAAVGSARAAGVRTGLLSNSWGGRDYPLDELRSIFDSIVSVNVKGAEAVGMSGILHRDARATIERLEDLFGLFP